MLVKIIKCSNKECIGFTGHLVTPEVWSKITVPFAWKEVYEMIEHNQICIIGKDASFVSDPNGYVEYKIIS